MGIDAYVVLGSAVVGLLVGLTGAGGGALMTSMLILLFSGVLLAAGGFWLVRTRIWPNGDGVRAAVEPGPDDAVVT